MTPLLNVYNPAWIGNLSTSISKTLTHLTDSVLLEVGIEITHTTDSFLDAGGAAWFDSNWINRKKITVKSSEVDADKTDFPILIDRTDTDFSAARADGFDFVLTEANGTTEVPYEREKWVDGTGELILWFKGDILAGTDVDFYIYYNNSAQGTDKADKNAVWSDNFASVYHLKNTEDYTDSVGNYDGSATASVADVVAKIGDGSEFNGSDGEIDIDNQTQMNSVTVLTYGCWCSPDSIATNMVYGRKEQGDGFIRVRLESDEFNNEFGGAKLITSSAPAQVGVLKLCTTVYDGNLSGDTNRLKFFINGVQETLTVSTSGVPAVSGTSTNAMFIGRHEFWDGIIDEFRIESVARTADYLLTTWRMQNTPGNFTTFGSEETE